MNVFNIPIEVDESLLPNVIKFKHPRNREDVFLLNGVEPVKVIDLTPLKNPEEVQ